MISPNVAICIKGFQLIFDGAVQEGYDLVKGYPAKDADEALQILSDQGLWAGKFIEIGARHGAKENERVGDVLMRAAAAGDKEAQALIDCGILEERVYGQRRASQG